MALTFCQWPCVICCTKPSQSQGPDKPNPHHRTHGYDGQLLPCLCLKKAAFEHTTNTTDGSHLLWMFCIRYNNSPYQQVAVACIHRSKRECKHATSLSEKNKINSLSVLFVLVRLCVTVRLKVRMLSQQKNANPSQQSVMILYVNVFFGLKWLDYVYICLNCFRLDLAMCPCCLFIWKGVWVWMKQSYTNWPLTVG